MGAEDPRGRAPAGIADFPIFGEVTLNDAVDLAGVRSHRGLPQVLDFPFQQVATGYASGAIGRAASAGASTTTTTSESPNGVDPMFATFLGNHDMGRGGSTDRHPGARSRAAPRCSGTSCSGGTSSTCSAARRVVQWGDEVGMIGSGGDRAAREDMFPTQVADWQTQRGSARRRSARGSSFDVTANPLERS